MLVRDLVPTPGIYRGVHGDHRSSGDHNLDCAFSCGPQKTERACAFQKTVSECTMDMQSVNA